MVTEILLEDEEPHQPPAPEAPIPGRHWYSGCDPDLPTVGPDGVCRGCGEKACPKCGRGFYPDFGCGCDEATDITDDEARSAGYTDVAEMEEIRQERLR